MTDIEFFNINDDYFVFDPNSKWVIDGGVQIRFGEEIFSFGWDETNEGIDYSIENKLEKQLGELPFYSLDAKKVNGINSLIGKEIKDVELKWQYYQEYDDDFELKEEKIYTPVEIILRFESDEFLQLAIISFQIKKDPFEIVNAIYDLNGQFLVSLNGGIEITSPPLEL